MNLTQKVSVTIAFLLYWPLSYQILKGKATQNLATFILWGLLDVIVGVSLFVQGGNYQLPLVYVAGCTLVIASIVKSKNFGRWTSYETFVSIMVVGCCVAWALSGSWYATIFSTAGVVIAGLPQIRDSWRNPETSPVLIYIGYTVANSLSTIGGKSWTVEERLYSGACTILTLVVIGASLRTSPKQRAEYSH